jgi:hypothetical protein
MTKYLSKAFKVKKASIQNYSPSSDPDSSFGGLYPI